MGNNVIVNCIDPTKSCPKTATNSRKQWTFNLYNATGEKVAGKLTNPQGYDWNGGTCNAGDRKCLWGAVAYFWATCPPSNPSSTVPATTCTNPSTINVRLQITPFSAAQPKKGVKFKEFPRNKFFRGKKNVTSFAISVSTAEVIDLVEDECAVDQKQTGLNPDGTPICECVVKATKSNGKFKKDGFGRQICGPQMCKTKFEVMTGFNGDTGKIECLNMKKLPQRS